MSDLEHIPESPKQQIVMYKAPRGLEVPAHFDQSKAEIFVKICIVADWIKFSDLYTVELLVEELFQRIELLEVAANFRDAGEYSKYAQFTNQARQSTKVIIATLKQLGMTPRTCPKFVAHGPSRKKLMGLLDGE